MATRKVITEDNQHTVLTLNTIHEKGTNECYVYKENADDWAIELARKGSEDSNHGWGQACTNYGKGTIVQKGNR